VLKQKGLISLVSLTEFSTAERSHTAAMINKCKGGIACRNFKRMWKCGEEHGMKFQEILPCWSQTLRFSFGLLIYTSNRFTAIYGRLPLDF